MYIAICFATTRMDARNSTHVTGSSYAWFIFILNAKCCYSQIIYYSVHMQDIVHVNPALAPHCPHPLTCRPPSMLPTFLLTWRTSYLARGANTHPLLSLVCYRLFTLCHFSHPNTPHRSRLFYSGSPLPAVQCPAFMFSLSFLLFSPPCTVLCVLSRKSCIDCPVCCSVLAVQDCPPSKGDQILNI
jgi:hypothetical protein